MKKIKLIFNKFRIQETQKKYVAVISDKYVAVISKNYVAVISDKYVAVISDGRTPKNIFFVLSYYAEEM